MRLRLLSFICFATALMAQSGTVLTSWAKTSGYTSTIPRPRGRGPIEANENSAPLSDASPIPRPRGRGPIEAEAATFSC